MGSHPRIQSPNGAPMEICLQNFAYVLHPIPNPNPIPKLLEILLDLPILFYWDPMEISNNIAKSS